MRPFFVFTLAGLLFSSVRATADDLPTPKQIFDAWGVAADGFQSVKIVWTEKVHVTAYEGPEMKIVNDAIRKRMEKAGLPVPDPGPTKDRTFENRFTLILANGKWRKEMSGYNYQSVERKVIAVEQIKTYDGKASQSFDRIEGNPNRGAIETNPNFHIVEFGIGWTAALQVFDRKWTTPAARFARLKVNGTTAINGQTVLRVTNPKPQNDVEELYTLLPDNRFAVAAYELKVEDKVFSRFTADFDSSLPIPSYPKRTKTDYFDEGKLTLSYEHFVVSMKVNEPLPPNAFAIDFPPGTEVRDMTVTPNKVYTIPGKPADPKSPSK